MFDGDVYGILTIQSTGLLGIVDWPMNWEPLFSTSQRRWQGSLEVAHMAERKMHHFDANNQCKEKLQENPIFKGEISGFRLGFSHKPIHANNIYKFT